MRRRSRKPNLLAARLSAWNNSLLLVRIVLKAAQIVQPFLWFDERRVKKQRLEKTKPHIVQWSLPEQGNVPASHRFFIRVLLLGFYLIHVDIVGAKITFEFTVPLSVDVV